MAAAEPNDATLEGSIKSLDTETVRLITAGEVYSKGVSNVVKELVENSIDAKAANITVQWEKGGYLSLSVADDGLGIAPEDVKVLCQRHTTSKIRSIGDLISLHTFGFRGEALNCLTYTAGLDITSFASGRTDEGFKATFLDGQLVRCAKETRPAAHTAGTILVVRNLFRKHSNRRKSANIASETSSIINYLTELSFLYPRIAFHLRDLTSGHSQSFPPKANCFDRIKSLHNDTIKGLLFFTDKAGLWSYEAVISSIASLSSSGTSPLKSRFISCVNNRPVSWPWIK